MGEAFANGVHFVVGRVGLFDVVRRHGEEAETIAGVAPVPVEAHLVEGDGNGVTGFGAFDVEGPGERVGAAGLLFAVEVLAGGVEGFGGYLFARFDALFNGVFVEERPVVFFSREGEC